VVTLGTALPRQWGPVPVSTDSLHRLVPAIVAAIGDARGGGHGSPLRPGGGAKLHWRQRRISHSPEAICAAVIVSVGTPGIE
jgi:hypothetical protein